MPLAVVAPALGNNDGKVIAADAPAQARTSSHEKKPRTLARGSICQARLRRSIAAAKPEVQPDLDCVSTWLEPDRITDHSG